LTRCRASLTGGAALPVVVLLLAACGGDPAPAADDAGESDAGAATAACVCNPGADTLCVRYRCDPTGTCRAYPRPDGTPCDDGDTCTAGDVCKASGDTSTCTAGPHSRCACRKDADCANDGNLCNGTRRCSQGILPRVCEPVPGTAKTCPDAGPCAISSCDPATGACKVTARSAGAPCDDGDECTTADACVVAAGGSALCRGKPTCECTGDADCDDGDKCRQRICGEAGVCKVVPKSVVVCPDATVACRHYACRPETGVCGLVADSKGAPCDDGDKCTSGDTCSGGACVPGTNTCACTVDKDCLALDDGDPCNGVPVCDKAAGACIPSAASVVVCPTVDDQPCLHNACDPTTGGCKMMAREQVTPLCTTTKVGSGAAVKLCRWVVRKPGDPSHAADTGPWPCDDGDPCTSGSSCSGKICKASGKTCHCQADADCEKADDGNRCNGTWYCDKSLAVADCAFNPASAVYCANKDDTACMAAACDPQTGKCSPQPRNTGKSCDDGDACTGAGVCLADGTCTAKPTACDDDNPCTADSCAAKSGCVHVANVALCDDGDGCTENDVCAAGQCAGTDRICDDGNACTQDACDPASGKCTFKKRTAGTLCNADSNGCTVNDSCDAGACVAGPALACSNKVAVCLEPVCQSVGAHDFKCAATASPDGTPCPDKAGSCLVGAACQAGACVPGKGKGRFSLKLAPAGRSARFDAIAAHADGSLVAAGQSWEQGKGGGRWYVVARTRTGAALWQWELSSDTTDHRHAARGAVARLDGTTWIGGTRAAKGHKLAARIVRLSGAGKVLASRTFGSPSGHDLRLVELIAGPLSAMLVVTVDGKPTTADNGNAAFRAVAADGSDLWRRAPHPSAPDGFPAGAWLADGRLYTRSTEKVGAGTRGRESWQEPVAGTQLLFQEFDAQAYSYTGPAVDGGDGHAWNVAGGGAKRQTLVRRIRVQGGTATVVADERRALALAPSAAGGVWIAGHTDTDSKPTGRRPWLARVDRDVNVQWHRLLELTPGAYGDVADLVELPDGTLAAVGQRGLAGVESAWLAVMSPWGDTACGGGGACESRTLAACDDGKACTRDFCDPAVGCQAVAVDTRRCPTPDSCSDAGECNAGACVGSDEGRYRTATVGGGRHVAGLRRESADVVKALTRHDTGNALTGVVELRSMLTDRAVLIGSPLTRAKDLCAAPVADHYTPHPGGGEVLAASVGAGNAAKMVFCGNRADSSFGFRVLLDGGCATCRAYGRDTDATPVGTVFAVGWEPDQGDGAAAFVRIEADQLTAGTGAQSSRWHLTKAATALEPFAVQTLTDATSIVIGEHRPKGKGASGWVARVGHDGALNWQTAVAPGSPEKGASAGFREVARVDDTRVVAVGVNAANAFARRGWIVGLSTAGKVLWQQVPKTWDGVAWNNVLVVADGLFVAGDVNTPAGPRMIAMSTGPSGGERWRRVYTGGPATGTLAVRGVVLRGNDGGYFLGTRDAKPTQNSARVYRIGPWGEISCKQAGKCRLYKRSDCDDGKACTADLCLPDKGCVFKPIPGCGG